MEPTRSTSLGRAHDGLTTSPRSKTNAPYSIVPAIRTALVRDAHLYEFLLTNAGALRRRQPRAMHHLARRCMHWQELDLSREGAVCRQLGDGTAGRLGRLAPNLSQEEVAVYGVLVDVAYAYLAGTLPIADLERAVALVEALGFNLFTPELYALPADAARRVKQDRPPPTMLLLKGIGLGVELQSCDASLLDHAVRLIESRGGEAVHWVNLAGGEQ